MRIAIVNDVRLACEALRRAITKGSKHTIAWVAFDGQQAIDHARRDTPDLILMDLIMPEIDGVEATRHIMAESPCPILVVTSTVSGNISKVFEAMGHGALDAVETPRFGPNGELAGDVPLTEKIMLLEKLLHRRASRPLPQSGSSIFVNPLTSPQRPPLVLLGASTGGPRVLADLLSRFPIDLAAPILIAQHVDENYVGGLSSWLAARSKLPVRLAETGMVPEPGRVYVASSTEHLVIASDQTLRYVSVPAGWYRPSVDALFHSAARHCRTPGVAALLTGMMADGAAGMAALRQAGWRTIAQDKATSVVWGMPKAAIDLGAVESVLPANEIVPAILSALRSKSACATARHQ